MRRVPVVSVLLALALVVACNQEDPVSGPTSVTPNIDAIGNESWIITTYYWDGSDWIEHGWWNAAYLEQDLRVVLVASNWLNYPSFDASFDNFYASGDIDGGELSDDFAGKTIGPLWWGEGEECNWWGIEKACQDEEVVIHIAEGVEDGEIRRAAGFNTQNSILHGEFEVDIDFSVLADFHSKDYGVVTFAVVDDRERSASIQMRANYYESVERDGWELENTFRPHGRTFTNHQHGKFRIKRTRVSNPGRVIESVAGSGSFTYPEPDGWRTFSFSARRHANGMVDGTWVRVNRDDAEGTIASRGVVTCITIVGDEAWIGGYATSGPYSEPPDNAVRWRVRDNGSGRWGPPDQISLQSIGWPADAEFFSCANTPTGLELHDIEAGSIQVIK